MAYPSSHSSALDSGFDHVVIEIRRVSRTVKGGRRFRFRAAVVIGDRQGQVGLGVEKGKDVQAAVGKAQAAARRHLRMVPLRGGTIPHAAKAAYGGAEVLLKPAPAGAGIIAGSAVRSLASLAGIRDLSSKLMGSRNKLNATKAALKALGALKAPSAKSQ